MPENDIDNYGQHAALTSRPIVGYYRIRNISQHIRKAKESNADDHIGTARYGDIFLMIRQRSIHCRHTLTFSAGVIISSQRHDESRYRQRLIESINVTF